MSERHDMQDDRELDGLLFQAMAARPGIVPQCDLAAEAIGRVRVREEQAAKLARLGNAMRVSGLAAGFLLLIGLGVVLWRAAENGEGSGAGSSGTSLTQVSSEGSSSDDVQATALTLLGLAAVGVAAKGALAT